MYHQITVLGNVGRDPEMRYTPSGQAVCNFSVASTRKFTGKNDEKLEETVWFRVATWGKQAEVCNTYVKKGMKVLVVGRLTPDKATGGPRVYESNGNHKASFEITAETVRFIGGERAEATPTEKAEEELPF